MGFGMILLSAVLAAAVVGMGISQEASADRPVDVLVYGYNDGVRPITVGHIALLESRGYVVEVTDGPVMAEQMAKASVVVGWGLNVKDAEAREALVGYVYEGGRLLLLLDTQYGTCGTEEKPCWYDFTKEAFGFKFDGAVQHGTVLPAEGSEQHPVWNSPNTLSEFSDWCCDAYVAEIVDEQNVEVIATVSGQSYKHGVYSTVQNVPAIVVNDNSEWGSGMVVGAGIDMVVGWRGPDMRMFDNLIEFMVPDRKAVPVPVAAITDEVDGFTELDGAHSVGIAQISGRTYAVVVSFEDDGVQIVEITYPWAPVPVAAITDRSVGFTELDGAEAVEITQISGRTYAVVASPIDDGVQIIDITYPPGPVPVASITDGVDGFTELAGAQCVGITQIYGRTYTVVIGQADDGVQIIDITHPAVPVPVAAITDEVDGFTELDGAHNVEIAYISGRTYAVVSSVDDDGVQIIDITHPAVPVPVAAITDEVDGFTELDGAHNVEIAYISGRTYAVVSSVDDDGVQIIDITHPAIPVPVAAITDEVDGFTELRAAQGVAIAQINGKTYAVITGRIDDGVQIIDITHPANPVPIASITDGMNGFAKLDGAVNVEMTQIFGRTYALVAAANDDSIQIIDISATGLSTSAPPDPVSEGGFYTNLDAVITVTDYQRTEYGSNSLVQITAQIANHEDLVLTRPNHQNNYKDGEILIFLGGTMPPPSKGTEYRNSFGYGDKSSQWLRGNGANVSPQDCTSEGYWTDIQPTETGVEKLCFWVPHNFTPDGLFVATYDVLHGQVTTNLNDVIIRAQIIPFTVDSAYCNDHPNICNVHGLQNIDSDTYTEPHPPYIHYSDTAR